MAINPDLYEIRQFVDELKKSHIDVNEENTLLMGIFGYLGDISSQQILNSILVASETIQEAFPINARFEKNILSHAISASIKDINATPAAINGFIAISERELLANMGPSNSFILDKKSKIMIDKFEFHLDYNIRISKNNSINGNNIYIAQYEIDNYNPLSDITKPYISPPVKTKISGDDFILVNCLLRQVEFQEKYEKIISDDSIQNKSFEFEFDNQLAYFDILVDKPNKTQVVLEPIIEGTPILDDNKMYCHYTYTHGNRIRIKFIRDSYNPRINENITVRIKSTQGFKGNFTYKQEVMFAPESDIYRYNNITMMFKPISSSENGVDKKSVEDLKKIIPKEILSRGSITSNKDLENFFNMIDDKYSRMIFRKKIDNQIERLYYSYLLLKNDMNNVVPTNTLDIKIPESELIGDIFLTDRYMIKPGMCLKYDEIENKCFVVDPTNLDPNKFYYTIPYLVVVTKKPLGVSYYLNIFNKTYLTEFTYINNNSFLQFICTSLNNKREFLTDRNTYKLSIDVSQNIDTDFGMGDINTDKLKAFFIFYDAQDSPVRYGTSDIVFYDESLKQYTFECKVDTDDSMTENSYIKIKNLYNLTTTEQADIYLPRQSKVIVYVAAKFDQEYGRDDMDNYIPGMAGYTLCNKYTINPGVEFFINYSEIIKSNISINKPTIEEPEISYNIKSIPMLKYSYIQNENRVQQFIDNIINRKLYIDHAMTILEDSFAIDFKFFNTYGPSKTFLIGHDNTKLNRTNISLNFNIKLDTLSDENIILLIKKEIKQYIEDINSLTDLHMINMIDNLKEKFPTIVFMEFAGLNNYDSKYQYIKRINDNLNVPEFLNINHNENTNDTAINITVV